MRLFQISDFRLRIRATVSAVGIWLLLWVEGLCIRADRWLDSLADAWRQCGIVTGPDRRARRERQVDDV